MFIIYHVYYKFMLHQIQKHTNDSAIFLALQKHIQIGFAVLLAISRILSHG